MRYFGSAYFKGRHWGMAFFSNRIGGIVEAVKFLYTALISVHRYITTKVAVK